MRHKFLRHFDIKTDHQTTGPNNNQQQQKENTQNCGLCRPGGPPSKVERERKEG